MAKAQWLAANSTIGQPPSGLDNLLTADGQLLSDWEIVADAGASGGRALKLVSGTALRRRLVLPGITADTSTRVDVRGRAYVPSTINNTNHLAVIRAGGSGASDGVDAYARLTGARKAEVRRYDPSPNSYSPVDTGSGVSTSYLPGWVRFRFTWDPDATPKLRFVAWAEGGGGSDASPDTVTTSDSTYSVITGNRIGHGSPGAGTGDLLDWLTVGTGEDDADIEPSGGGDTTAPILTSPTASATGATTASGSVSTDEGNGTLYWLASVNASESGATVKGGASQPVTSTGTQNVSVTGLSASTNYRLHFLHRDAAGNDSTVATSSQFSTDAAPAAVKGVRIQLHDGASPVGPITGVHVMWWDAETPTGAPAYESSSGSIDASGWFELDLDSETSLDLADVGHLKLYKSGASAQADLHFVSRLPVVDIA